ncbi:MAG: alpha/beta fold hydrolase [Flavobacteriales bacterium]
MVMLLPYVVPLKAISQTFSNAPFPESRYVKIEGTWVHFRPFPAEGDSFRSPVMLVHGFSGSTFSWRFLIPVLTKNGYPVVAIDLPPFGFSDKRKSASVSDSIWADLIHGVINTLTAEQFVPEKKWVLFGHSMGGMVIGSFATEYPERCKGLVYVDGTSPNSDGKRPFSLRASEAVLRMGFIQRWADVMMENFIYSEKRFTELLRSAYQTEPAKEVVRGYMEPFQFRTSASAVFRFAANTGYAKVDGRVLKQFPRLLIWGEKDTWIPAEGARNFLKQNPDVEGHFIPDAGHCPMETHPKEFTAIAMKWLRQL